MYMCLILKRQYINYVTLMCQIFPAQYYSSVAESRLVNK
jgi:hypothetical protein